MDHHAMEHRWGVRRSVNLKIVIISQPGVVAPGWLLDVSVSGGLVSTALLVPVLSTVRIVPPSWLLYGVRQSEIPACVVRRGVQSLALEWWELAPLVVQRLVANGPAMSMAPSYVSEGTFATASARH